MFTLCPQCKQHYDDTSDSPKCDGFSPHRRQFSNNVATRARLDTQAALKDNKAGRKPPDPYGRDAGKGMRVYPQP